MDVELKMFDYINMTIFQYHNFLSHKGSTKIAVAMILTSCTTITHNVLRVYGTLVEKRLFVQNKMNFLLKI